MDGVVFYINVIIDYECAFDYRNMIIDLSSGSKKNKKKHKNISSNNILLNNKLEGFVSDFGTAKLLDLDSSNQTLVAGTYGYIAPGELLFSCYN
jgi:hypothetical protein